MRTVWSLFWHRPQSMLLPFTTVAMVETVLLVVLYLAPRPPVLSVLGPPIRRFFGEAYLHYPLDLVLLPRLFQKAQVGAGLFWGSMMAGALVWIIVRLAEDINARPPLRSAVFGVQGRYFSLLFVGCVIYTLTKGVLVVGNTLFKKTSAMSVLLGHSVHGMVWPISFVILSVVFYILIQSVLVFCVPAIVKEDVSVWGSVRRSFQMFRLAPGATLAVVSLSIGVNLILSVAQTQLPVWMERTLPEVSFWFLFGSVGLTTLVNSFLVGAATVLYLDGTSAVPLGNFSR